MNILLLGSSTLGLVLGDGSTRTSDLLALVLGFLDGLAGPFDSLGQSLTDQSVFRFKLAHGFFIVVNQAEASGLTTAELCLETKQDGQFRIRLEHATDDFLQFLLGNVRATRVKDVHNHLQKASRIIRSVKQSSRQPMAVHLASQQQQ